MSTLGDFSDEFNRCWLCGTMAIHTWPPRLEIHHIVRGCNREKSREDRRVLIRTCQRCHAARLDAMPMPMQYALKAINDQDHFDRVAINRLRGRADDAVSDEEVAAEVAKLMERSLEQGSGHPFPYMRG